MFKGKIKTDEFLWKWLLVSLVYLVFATVCSGTLQTGFSMFALIVLVITILILVYRLSLYVRRLRDIGKNIWLAAFGLLPILDILLFIALLFDLNKWLTGALVIVAILSSIVPVVFASKIIKDNNMNKNFTKLNECYLLAKDGIYYYEISEFNTYKKIDANPSQFVTLDDALCYGKDESNVYYRDKVLKDANPDTFVLTNERYRKDNSNYYK